MDVKKRQRDSTENDNNKRTKRKLNLSLKPDILERLFELYFPPKSQQNQMKKNQIDNDVEMGEKDDKDVKMEDQPCSEFEVGLKKIINEISSKCDFKNTLELILLKFHHDKETLKSKVWECVIFWFNCAIVECTSEFDKMEKENMCSIRKSIMLDPVLLKKTGQHFNREELIKALKIKRRCPLTNVDLEGNCAIENLFVTNFDRKNYVMNFFENFAKTSVKYCNLLNKINMKNVNDKSFLENVISLLKRMKDNNINDDVVYYLCERIHGKLKSDKMLIMDSRIDLFMNVISRKGNDKDVLKYLNEKILCNIGKLKSDKLKVQYYEEILKYFENKRDEEKKKDDKSNWNCGEVVEITRNIVVSLIIGLKNVNKRDESMSMFRKYEKEFFEEENLKVLKLKLMFSRHYEEESKILLKMANFLCYKEVNLVEAEKYAQQSLNKKNTFECQKLLKKLFKKLNRSKSDIGMKYLLLSRFCKDSMFDKAKENKYKHYIERAYEYGPDVEEIYKEYMSYLMENDFKKFKEMSMKDCDKSYLTAMLVDEIDKKKKQHEKSVEVYKNEIVNLQQRLDVESKKINKIKEILTMKK